MVVGSVSGAASQISAIRQSLDADLLVVIGAQNTCVFLLVNMILNKPIYLQFLTQPDCHLPQAFLERLSLLLLGHWPYLMCSG